MNEAGAKRIHIIGGPGAGKTTLSRRLAKLLDVPLLELDAQGLRFQAEIGEPIDFDLLHKLREAHCSEFLASNQAWVAEGACVGPYTAIYDEADLIILVETSRRVALFRILLRHIKAELAGNNRFPGWRRLYVFWCWSARFYADTNPPGLNEFGTAATRAYMLDYLMKFQGKLVVCRTSSEIDELLQSLERAARLAGPSGAEAT